MSHWPPQPPDGEGDDNVILMPGVDRIPEPSPLRAGGPGQGASVPGGSALGGSALGGSADDGLERIDPDEQPPPHLLDAAVEALLFASDQPMTETRIDGHLGNPGIAEVRAALALLKARYSERGGGVRLVQVAHGWQLRSDPRFGRWVTRMLGGKPLKLSKAALEVLAIVSYRQPATKAEVDDLRGVDSGGVLRMLVERGMVHVTGRRDEPGRPLIYGSTPEFLSIFGLRDLSELPTLRDLHELQHDDPRLGPLPDITPRPPEEPQQTLPLLDLVAQDTELSSDGVELESVELESVELESVELEEGEFEDVELEDVELGGTEAHDPALDDPGHQRLPAPSPELGLVLVPDEEDPDEE